MLFGVADTKSNLYKIREGNKKTLAYRFYENMLARCYYPKTARYESYGGIGVEVSKEWLSYHNFAEWFYENYVEGFHLDKDILSIDGMLYSKEVCCFVPRELNNLFIQRPRVNDTDLPVGVFRMGGKFLARTIEGICKSFETQEVAAAYVIDKKFEKCLSILDKYEDKIRGDVVLNLKDREFFISMLKSLDCKRRSKFKECQ